MIKKFILLFLLIPTISFATPPTRQFAYESGSTILSDENTANEDSIYNYLQAGVDTYSDASIFNADISTSANIQSDKLNLTAIAQAVGITSGGSFDNNGTTKLDGAVTVTATTTFAGATISNLGTVTTADINGGTIDGTAIGASSTSTGAFSTLKVATTNQGDVLYDNGTSFIRLTPGVSGQFLKTNGAAANPAWATLVVKNILGGSGSVGSPSQNYFDPNGGGNTSTTETNVGMIVPFAGTLKNLYVERTAAGGGTPDSNWTVYKGGLATTLTVAVTSELSGNDTTHTVSVVAGDRISLNIGQQGSGTIKYMWGFELDPS